MANVSLYDIETKNQKLPRISSKDYGGTLREYSEQKNNTK